jgi:hypothetical protein
MVTLRDIVDNYLLSMYDKVVKFKYDMDAEVIIKPVGGGAVALTVIIDGGR